ncbi:MFS transporter [Neobacillus sp. PS3-40]|uniref:MFS transporter n=1 Tax=Neobacillus sp. PS3-40 TaxID=3070679 RepID=UPI0027E1FAD8|nr:MFS transporter [Neobacillus sp. PS3-40]WML44810.1 MFS transporter [Neobacillus sp. PS3-40]
MDIFKNRLFTKLFLATFTSQLGSTIGNMAFAFFLLDHFSKQPYYATIAELMYSLPILLVFFIVGVVADRFDRKKIAENSDWIRACLTVLLFVAIYFNNLLLVFIVLFIRSAVSKFFAPAEMSVLQGVLDKEQYMKASGLNQTVMGLFMLFGVGLGALSYHYLGIKGSVIIDGVSFIISAILIRSCAIPFEVRLPNGKTKVKEINYKLILSDFREGFKYIFHFKLLKSIVSGFLVFGLINGGFAVLPIFTMKYKLAPDHYEQYSSLFSIFLGMGFIIGSTIGNKLIQKFKVHRVLISGVLLSGIVTIVIGTLSNVWIFFVLVLVMGIILAPVNIAISGWMTELVDPKFMGRVSGWIDPLMMSAHSLALGIIAIVFPAFVRVDTIYFIIGILLISVGLYYLLILPGLVRGFSKITVKNELPL